MAGSDAPADWRFKAGIAIFISAFAVWLLVPLAAATGASPTRIAALAGMIFVGNKVLLLACIAVMGKAGFQRLKSLAFRFARGLLSNGADRAGDPRGPIGPVRHAIGLTLFCVPLGSAMLESYVFLFWPGLRPNLWQLESLGDVLLIASFFVLGGDFWSKIRALFIRGAVVIDPRDSRDSLERGAMPDSPDPRDGG